MSLYKVSLLFLRDFAMLNIIFISAIILWVYQNYTFCHSDFTGSLPVPWGKGIFLRSGTHDFKSILPISHRIEWFISDDWFTFLLALFKFYQVGNHSPLFFVICSGKQEVGSEVGCKSIIESGLSKEKISSAFPRPRTFICSSICSFHSCYLLSCFS